MNTKIPAYVSPALREVGTVVKKVICVSPTLEVYGQKGRAAVDPEELYEYEL